MAAALALAGAVVPVTALNTFCLAREFNISGSIFTFFAGALLDVATVFLGGAAFAFPARTFFGDAAFFGATGFAFATGFFATVAAGARVALDVPDGLVVPADAFVLFAAVLFAAIGALALILPAVGLGILFFTTLSVFGLAATTLGFAAGLFYDPRYQDAPKSLIHNEYLLPLRPKFLSVYFLEQV